MHVNPSTTVDVVQDSGGWNDERSGDNIGWRIISGWAATTLLPGCGNRLFTAAMTPGTGAAAMMDLPDGTMASPAKVRWRETSRCSTGTTWIASRFTASLVRVRVANSVSWGTISTLAGATLVEADFSALPEQPLAQRKTPNATCDNAAVRVDLTDLSS
ncbi:MAG: hypothetical protein ACK5S6_02900, partial [bacterium]